MNNPTQEDIRKHLLTIAFLYGGPTPRDKKSLSVTPVIKK